VYLGLATDITFAKEGIVMNPHYKKMGLFGSELHTATAARKFGFTILRHMTRKAEPMIVSEGLELNILDRL
jgi:putative two-component system hydrogenase maturation factor HypX/HoxX